MGGEEVSWGRGVGEGRGEEWVQRRTAVGEGVAKNRITVAASSQCQKCMQRWSGERGR